MGVPHGRFSSKVGFPEKSDRESITTGAQVLTATHGFLRMNKNSLAEVLKRSRPGTCCTVDSGPD